MADAVVAAAGSKAAGPPASLAARKALFEATGRQYLVVGGRGPIPDRIRRACGTPVRVASLKRAARRRAGRALLIRVPKGGPLAALPSGAMLTGKGRPGGELDGRVALVTGAGSGLGRNISLGLAKAGAAVALLDIDLPSVKETAALTAREAPGAPTIALACDVTSPPSVDAAFARVAAEWGGLDITVNAAGIAPPFALVDLPVEKWRAALELNLTGYFLVAQAAARLFIPQGMGGSIVNISSKSGLEASRNNTPYNATKAGEIHMARGWALELGVHGIRVNSVAPGNVFEGSKIWNPEYIKVCARKYGIKPSEVIPYYTNMTALKKETKGQDVADCVVFLCSGRARVITGQVLVVDGGQVMVR